jgi:hypothetical protein
MVDLVHGNTTDGRSNVEPPASSSLAQLAIVVVNVASNADGRTSVLAHSSNFTALESNLNVLAGHDPSTVVFRLLVLVDNHS